MATKWGCIGVGKIAHDFFLSIQDNLPSSEHQFISVAARDVGRAQQFSDKFKFQRAYGSYDEMAKDPDVEVVYIATININHAELSIQMLEAGKHVLCEKPMAMNYREVQRVLKVAKEKGKLFIEAAWSRWFPIYDQIKQEIKNGTLGDVKLVQANFCVPIKDVDRVKNVKMGGGGLLDIGIYVVQFACFVFGEMPESITAVGSLMGEVDQNACILMKYKNGGMANITYHTDCVPVYSCSVLGPKGKIVIEEPFYCPTKATMPSGTYEFPLKPSSYNFLNSAGLHYEAAGTRECLMKGLLESPKMSHADSEMIHKIMDEVRRQIGMRYPDFD